MYRPVSGSNVPSYAEWWLTSLYSSCVAYPFVGLCEDVVDVVVELEYPWNGKSPSESNSNIVDRFRAWV